MSFKDYCRRVLNEGYIVRLVKNNKILDLNIQIPNTGSEISTFNMFKAEINLTYNFYKSFKKVFKNGIEDLNNKKSQKLYWYFTESC